MARSSPAVGERRDRFVQDLLNEERGRVAADPILWGGGVSLAGAPVTQAATTLQMRLLPVYVPRPFQFAAYAVAVTAAAGVVRLRAGLYRYVWEPPNVSLALEGHLSKIEAIGGPGLFGLHAAEPSPEPVPPGVYFVGVVATIGGGGALTLRATQTPAGGWTRTISDFSNLPGSLGWRELATGAGFAVGMVAPPGGPMLEGL